MEHSETMREVVEELGRMADQGEVVQALSRINALLRKHPNDIHLRYMKALVFARHFPAVMAQIEVRQYRKAFPTDKEGPILLASVLQNSGRSSKALEEIKKSEAIGKLSSYGSSLKTCVLSSLGRDGEARETLASYASRPDAGGNAFWDEVRLSEPDTEDEMLTVADKARSLGESPQYVARFVAHWYVKRNQLQSADKVLQAALSDAPLDKGLIQSMISLDRDLGRWHDALRRANQIFERDPTDLWAFKWLSTYYTRRFRVVSKYKVLLKHLQAVHKLSSKEKKNLD